MATETIEEQLTKALNDNNALRASIPWYGKILVEHEQYRIGMLSIKEILESNESKIIEKQCATYKKIKPIVDSLKVDWKPIIEDKNE